jgi:hypothetical protein
MQITYEHDARQRARQVSDAVERAYQRGGAPHRDAVSIIMTGDFDRSVRQRLVLPPGVAMQYTQQRRTGFAGAKTMLLPNGDSCAIVVDARMSSPQALSALGADDVELDRVLAHESWHAVLLLRGEHDGLVAERLARSPSHAFFLRRAARMFEEYRVERAVCERGWLPKLSFAARTKTLLDELVEGVLEAVVERYPGENDVGRMFDTLVHVTLEFVTQLGYTAAEALSAPQRDPAPRLHGTFTWQRYLGDYWAQIVAALDKTPAADTPTGQAALDQTADALAGLLDAWLRHVGFALTAPEGELHLDVIRTDFLPSPSSQRM